MNVFTNGAGTWLFTAGANWSTGTVPANGENWTISNEIGPGTIQGWDHSDRKYGKIVVPAGCQVQIGTSGTPARFTAASIAHYGSAPMYLRTSTSGSSIVDRIIVRSPLNGEMDEAVIPGRFALILSGAADVTLLEILGGGVYMTAFSGAVTRLQVKGSSARFRSDVSGVGAIGTALVHGGRARTGNEYTRCTVSGGGWLMIEAATASSSLLICDSQSRVEYPSTTTLPYVLVAAGTLDLCTDPRPRTVTLLETGPSAKVVSDDHVTITSNNALPGTVVRRGVLPV